MDSILPDPSTPFGARVAQRLRDEKVIWLVTVSADGTPQPNPVWFLWDGLGALIYSRAEAARLPHIARNPHVALHFDGNGHGGDIVVLTGTLAPAPEAPPADEMAAFAEKYSAFIARRYGTPGEFARLYPVALRFTPARVRGF